MVWQDAKRQARNQLKMELQEYQDVWEYKQVKIGPLWFTRKVLKKQAEHHLAEQRANEMSELLPELDEVRVVRDRVVVIPRQGQRKGQHSLVSLPVPVAAGLS